MLSDVRRKKLLFAFKKFFDADESGAVEKKDFEKSLDRVVRLQGWKETDVVYNIAKDIMVQIWEGFVGTADTDKDGKVTTEEWLNMWEKFDKEMPEWNNLFCKVCFHLQDKSGDGQVDEEEFAKAHEVFGEPKEVAQEAFKKFSQGKTSINWEDFQVLFKEFFLSDDAEAPGNYIFGTVKFLKD